MPRGNIGEWSEAYALAYLLVHGGAFAGDSDQQPIPTQFHKVLKVKLSGLLEQDNLEYVINDAQVSRVSGEIISTIASRSSIEDFLTAMLLEFHSKRPRGTFTLESGVDFLNLIQKNQISAGSNQNVSDLDLTLVDEESGSPTPRIGFNIKSQIGGRSTLLNASGSTNFTYKILNNSAEAESVLPVFRHGKHTQNLQALYAAGYRLEFYCMKSDTFQNSLTLIDMLFPQHLAKILLESYLSGEDDFERVVSACFPEDQISSRQPLFKIKEFLGAIAMGLRPSKIWDGDNSRFSGIIVVKPDGDLVFYYLDTRKNFEQYLFKNVAFERPSTTRHKYGSIFSENGENFLSLNLQIRFKS